MQIDVRRVYFNAVLGGLGGLLGWAAGSTLTGLVFGGSAPDRLWKLVLQQVLFGPAVGVLIGAAIGSADGLVISRSKERLRQGLKFGAASGAVGGLVGLTIGEIFFDLAGGGVWPRAVGWAIFGSMIGASDGYARGMPSNLRYGTFGGLLGGLIGSSAYDGLSSILLRFSDDRRMALALGSCTGLVILGACIGAMVGLVESLLRANWLSIRSGPHEGETRTFDLGRSSFALGRSGRCDLVLARDPSLADIHALFTREGREFTITPNGGAVLFKTDQGFVPIKSPRTLQDGDELKLGTSRLVYVSTEGTGR